MKASRKLSLRKESLVDLTAAEAALVAGASGVTCAHVTCGGPCNSDLVQCVTFGACESVVDGACNLFTREVC